MSSKGFSRSCSLYVSGLISNDFILRDGVPLSIASSKEGKWVSVRLFFLGRSTSGPIRSEIRAAQPDEPTAENERLCDILIRRHPFGTER